MTRFRIEITKASPKKYQLYTQWLQQFQPDIDFIDLSLSAHPIDDIKTSHGVLLPGGADVDPQFYGKDDSDHLCEVDRLRDELEFKIIKEAQRLELPILGICRGLQIMNVALGGTLIVDLPQSGKSGHVKVDSEDVEHTIIVEPDTHLASILAATDGLVNSSHHQAADRIAPKLKISACSGNGVVEALEWKEAEEKPYLMLVQWHPERMRDMQNIFSKNIATDFLISAQNYHASFYS